MNCSVIVSLLVFVGIYERRRLAAGSRRSTRLLFLFYAEEGERYTKGIHLTVAHANPYLSFNTHRLRREPVRSGAACSSRSAVRSAIID